MKIFYWDEILRDYTSGMVVSVAPNLEAALMAEEDTHVRGEMASKPYKVFDVVEGESHTFTCWGGG